MSRALTDGEHRALLLADEGDGRVLCMRRGMRDRLIAAGFAKVVEDGTTRPPAVITDAGRCAVRQQGSSGGRA